MKNLLEAFQKMPTSEEMRKWDEAAIAFGIPEKMLMDNAARGACEVLKETLGDLKDQCACFFMGGGNNGGDAAALARHVIDSGAHALIICLKPQDKIVNSSAWHLNLAIKNGAEFVCVDAGSPPAIQDFLQLFYNKFHRLPHVLIDGILGTGFSSPLHSNYINLIERLNQLSVFLQIPFLSLDIPSGLDALSGQPQPVAIAAKTTVTFAAPKPGLLMPHAKRFTGRLVCREIDLPASIRPECPASWRLLDASGFKAIDYQPMENSYKNLWGHVTVIGGNAGHSGAAHLASLAALRTGAGLVTAISTRNNLGEIKGHYAEIMTCEAGNALNWPHALTSTILSQLKKSDAIVMGPGMGLTQDAAKFGESVLKMENRPPAVLDADILRLFGAQMLSKKFIRHDDIITPHPGEAAALLGCSARDIQNDRLASLNRLCDLLPCVVILKGAGTLIGHGGAVRALSPYDIPQLAIGGAGDVLSGCLGALAASGYWRECDSFSKACLGVTLHALAGLLIAQKYPVRGALASDLANSLSHVFTYFTQNYANSRGSVPWPSF